MIIQSTIFFICILIFILTFYTTKLSIPFFEKFFQDIPNIRSSHKKTKPTGLGIIFAIFSSIAFLISDNVIYASCFSFAIIGLIDDFKGLSSIKRLIFQIGFSTFCFYNINYLFINNDSIILSLFLLFFYVFIFTGIVNTINFMDGIDGIVASCMVLVFFGISLKYDLNLLPLTFSLLGFLILNWSPAKVFMGDSGSTYLGSVYAITLMSSSSLNDFLEIILLTTPLLADAIICRFRILIKGGNIFSPHKLHLYQRLYSGGFSHSKISFLYASATGLLVFSFLNYSLFLMFILSLLIIFIGICLDHKFAVKF